MKKTLLSVIIIVLSAIYLNAQDLKVEQIIQKHLETTGQEKLNSVQSKKITGKLLTQGMEIPFTMIQKRPGKFRMDATFQGSTMVQAFNGTDGYAINPWIGSTEPQDVPEEQLKNFKDQGKFDSKFYKYSEAGVKLELIGKEDVNGKIAYRIKYTSKPEKEGEVGSVSDIFIDSENFQMVKLIAKVNMNNTDMEMENYFSNYKNVDGMSFPGTMEQKIMGNTMVSMTFDEVILNEPVEDSYFDKPKK